MFAFTKGRWPSRQVLNLITDTGNKHRQKQFTGKLNALHCCKPYARIRCLVWYLSGFGPSFVIMIRTLQGFSQGKSSPFQFGRSDSYPSNMETKYTPSSVVWNTRAFPRAFPDLSGESGRIT